ncbi:hypothetical protein [Streptomyces sp. NPDC002082]|uniref:hypothetical protein n=1 Tax=Streptomyces sp. NPDC002082 TaxID=3154772 RepID=UPI00331AE709
MSEAMVKKSVTIRRSIAEQIEERVGPGGFSGFVDAAAEHWLALLKAREIIEDHERRIGPLTDEVREEAQRAWRGQ